MAFKETTVQNHSRLAVAKAGGLAWRNNVGACVAIDKYGNERQVRYGLANESPQMNAHIKSSDLIGITPVTITPEMVGMTLGVFTALETKKEDWKFSSNDKRAAAQAKFHSIVREKGGFAGFVRRVSDIRRITTGVLDVKKI